MKHHIPRKRFGQNFLIDNNVIAHIVRALNPKPNQHLVEIGAGLGALTTKVLNEIDHLDVIEIDRDLGEKLQSTFSASQLTLYQADALDFDFSTLCQQNQAKLRIFGNLPYNISTPLLFHLLHYAGYIQDMLFMLQKEVVTRMAAKPNSKEYGRLSVMIQYFCQANQLFDVGPNSFSPPPKVTSSIVHLVPHDQNRPHPLAKNEKLFASIVTQAFSHRRKTLKNALTPLVPASVIEKVGIDPMRRPETLSITEFVNLSDALHEDSP
ncbi:MAG: 16S rRNA (adenine(1518)-N(6)/adenine(1519)-N(6))-dimethyltransferase RsmA [Proteobacteria bacterium]|nr:16S rRNA (adenine(1518)-N(6)/adenine(1519)-N(6))-dimethyltransferase RsmA [Pseudomonadota bacterium]